MKYSYLKYTAFALCMASTGLYAQTTKKATMHTTKKATAVMAANIDYPAYGGNKAGNRYTAANQINTKNVKDLQEAWTFDTGDNANGRGSDWQYQPIVVKGVMYVVTPSSKLVALDPATGKQLWMFNPSVTGKRSGGPTRGITYWEKGDDKRLIVTFGYIIYEVNATTGEWIKSFGDNGIADIHAGLKDNEVFGADPQRWSMRNTSPGTVYKDIYIVGSSMSEGEDAPPGYIQAFNVITGKLAWVFHTIPLPGEYGYNTWAPDSYKKIGAANDWTGFVVDDKRGIVYASTGSASVDFYGAVRPGQNLFANCIIAFDANTGKRLWHFQTIHHDMWDRDLVCPGNLVTVMHNGKKIDAIAQATKDGLLFILDRVTGRPVFPVKETPVTTSPALPGEHPWPTQPIPVLPKPYSMQELTEATITDRTPEAHAYVLERYNNSLHVSGASKYMPPSEKGTLYFGFGGGAEFGGTAADPNKGIIYINSNNMLWWQFMVNVEKRNALAAATPGSTLFNANCSSCHGFNGGGANNGDGAQPYPVLTDVGSRLTRDQINTLVETGRGRMPSFSNIPKADRDVIIDFLLKTEKNVPARANNQRRQTTPYSPEYASNGTRQFRDNEGYPAMKAPWGTLNAINMNTGQYLWQVPLGYYPALTDHNTGTENHGGAVVTGGGLLFIAATYDTNLRAFDTKTGKTLWQYKLPAGGFATPASYVVNGKQYVVIACGGTRYNLPAGGKLVAFALPDK